MIFSVVATFIALQGLPKTVDLRNKFSEFNLPICKQDGPWCWDFTTLGVLEYELAAELGRSGSLSPGYLAWAAQETDSQGTGGSNFGRANRGLESYGAVPLAMGGLPPSGGTVAPPDSKVVDAGRAFGEIEFHWIRFWSRSPITTDQLNAIKLDIAVGHPVAVGMQWPNRTAFVRGTTMMRVPPKRQIFDGHCVILVGYEEDPAVPGGGSFVFRNSWGADWADGGYARMPFALLDFCINDAYSIRKVTPIKKDSSGSVEIFDAIALKTVNSAAKLANQDMSRFGNAWGGKNQLSFRAGQIGDGFTLQLPVARAGLYEIQLVITRAEDYGQFRVTFPDGTRSDLIDGAGPGVSRSHPISLGKIHLRKGLQHLRFTIEGQSSASSGLGLGLVDVALRHH